MNLWKAMKAATLAFALLFSGAALADTITLATAGPVDCGTLRQCATVPNDVGVSVTALNAAAQYGRVLVTIGDVKYDSGLYIVLPMGDSFANVLLYGSDGSLVHITASYSVYYTYVRSGRGQTRVPHWSLIGGSIVR